VVTGAIKASLQLIQDAETDVDSFVAARVGEQIGRKIAAEVVSGAGPGSDAATGIIPSLAAFGTGGESGGYVELGTATALKLFSDASATELGNNVLSPGSCIAMLEALDPAYLPSAAWYMNQTQAWNMRQVLDDNSRPLINLDSSFADGAIGSLFGLPVRVVQEIPDLVASTVGGPILGALDHAMVLRMVSSAGMMRLTERYADFLQVGFIGYQRFDSQPVDLRAAVTVKPAAS
jgi:HK97 family phage major capsid protein